MSKILEMLKTYKDPATLITLGSGLLWLNSKIQKEEDKIITLNPKIDAVNTDLCKEISAVGDKVDTFKMDTIKKELSTKIDT